MTRKPSKKTNSMTAKEYNEVLRQLGLTPYAAAKHLGISLSQSHRYAAGTQPINLTVAILLKMYLKWGLE